MLFKIVLAALRASPFFYQLKCVAFHDLRMPSGFCVLRMGKQEHLAYVSTPFFISYAHLMHLLICLLFEVNAPRYFHSFFITSPFEDHTGRKVSQQSLPLHRGDRHSRGELAHN